MQDAYIRKSYCFRVVDGDTIDCEIDLGFQVKGVHRLRLARINTPERGQEGFHEAADYVRSRVQFKHIMVQTSKADMYGRYIAEVFYQDDMSGEYLNLNDLLLANKFAVEYRG